MRNPVLTGFVIAVPFAVAMWLLIAAPFHREIHQEIRSATHKVSKLVKR